MKLLRTLTSKDRRGDSIAAAAKVLLKKRTGSFTIRGMSIYRIKAGKHPLRLFDYILFLFGLLLVAGAILYTTRGAADQLTVHIQGENGEWLYPLDAEAEVAVDGPLGVTVVHIHDGSAYVDSSPCRFQICVSTGAISKPNEWAACLPNKVFVNIEGRLSDDREELDALTY